MPRFRTNYKGKGAWASVARALNDIGQCLNNLRGIGIEVVENRSTGGYDFQGAPARSAAGMWSMSVSGDAVAVAAGVVLVLGRGRVDVPARTVVVSGGSSSTPGYVFLRIARANPSSTATVFQITEPNLQSTTHWEIELARAYRTSAGVAVVISPRTTTSAIILGDAFA